MRAVAKKVFVAEIVRGKFYFGSALEKKPSYVLSPLGEKIIRASVVGTVTEKFESENFCSLTIDDGTDCIKAKVFGEPPAVEIGDVVNCIGRIREYNGQIYLSVEIIRKINFFHPNFVFL